MCQENNSAEAKLQKINKITALFSPGLQHTLLLGPPAETPEPAGIHRAPQQVMAPNPHGWGCHPSDSTHPEEPRGALAGQDATNTGVVVVPPPPSLEHRAAHHPARPRSRGGVLMPITVRLSPGAAQPSPFSRRPSAAGSAAPGRAV